MHEGENRLNRIVLALLVLALPGPVTPQNRPVRALHGMVVSAHPEASEVGTAILRRGGNVVDAAVAVGFALAVVYPAAGNIGGGGFAVAYLGSAGPLALDFREVAPFRASEGMYLNTLGNFNPAGSTEGARSVGVPGTVAGLYELHRKHGSLPWHELLAPAVALAGEGFLLTQDDAAYRNRYLGALSVFPSTRRYFTKGDSTTPYTGGERFVQKDLAATLRSIRDRGREGFYAGEVARHLTLEVGRHGGIITEGDLTAYQPVWRAPLIGTYRGYRIITMPPPSSGGWALLSLLKMLEPFRLDTLGFHSSSTVHLMCEAMKRVFADRTEYLGDPDFVDVPLASLLDSSFLTFRMGTFDVRRATPPAEIRPGLSDWKESRNTTHFSVADSAGNMVAITYTLNHGFGSKLAVEGGGFLLNNEMDDFSAKPNAPNAFGLLGGRANSIQPGKRMLSSMAPTVVMKNGRPFFSVGAPGGPTIFTRVFQVVTNVIDFGMNIQDAVAALRFHHQWPWEEIEYEPNALAADALAALSDKGWKLRSLEGWDNGGMDAILIDSTGVLHGAADPRRGDAASGY